MSITAENNATATIIFHFIETVPKSTADYADSPSGTALANNRELVAACLAGTRGAFATLMEQRQRRIYNVCYRFVGNHEDDRICLRRSSRVSIAGCIAFIATPNFLAGCIALLPMSA